jgi:hypothetical protein
VGHEDLQLVGRLTEVSDDSDRRGHDLAGLSLLVDLAQAAPLAEGDGSRDLNQGDAFLRAQSTAAASTTDEPLR